MNSQSLRGSRLIDRPIKSSRVKSNFGRDYPIPPYQQFSSKTTNKQWYGNSLLPQSQASAKTPKSRVARRWIHKHYPSRRANNLPYASSYRVSSSTRTKVDTHISSRPKFLRDAHPRNTLCASISYDVWKLIYFSS